MANNPRKYGARGNFGVRTVEGEDDALLDYAEHDEVGPHAHERASIVNAQQFGVLAALGEKNKGMLTRKSAKTPEEKARYRATMEARERDEY